MSGTYEEVLARDDVDAVYVGTVHTTHAELAAAALEAGKAVLCEKPISPSPELTESVLAAAARSHRLFVEGYKYRFGPLAQELRTLVARGDIGPPQRLEAAFGFKAPERSGRLFDPTLGGGAILDVGGYPVSLAVGLGIGAGMANATRPVTAAASAVVGSTGVDEWAEAEVGFGGFAATVRASIVQALPGDAVLQGSEGPVELLDVWGNRTQSGTTAVVRRRGEEPRRIEVRQVDPSLPKRMLFRRHWPTAARRPRK